MIHYNQINRSYFVTYNGKLVAKGITYNAAVEILRNGGKHNPSNLSTFVFISAFILGSIAAYLF